MVGIQRDHVLIIVDFSYFIGKSLGLTIISKEVYINNSPLHIIILNSNLLREFFFMTKLPIFEIH